MATAAERAMRRLQVVAASEPENRLRTLDRIRRESVTADSQWGDFLSDLNKTMAGRRDAIVQAYEAQELEPIVEILSDAMQDLLDVLADKFGYSAEGDEEEQDGEADDAQFDEEPASGTDGNSQGSPVTVIE